MIISHSELNEKRNYFHNGKQKRNMDLYVKASERDMQHIKNKHYEKSLFYWIINHASYTIGGASLFYQILSGNSRYKFTLLTFVPLSIFISGIPHRNQKYHARKALEYQDHINSLKFLSNDNSGNISTIGHLVDYSKQ